MSSLNWNGDAVKAKVIAAAIKGVDKTMAEAVVDAKRNHPGWQNRTGTAEGSINVVAFAQEDGPHVRGTWGSADVNYMIFLELKHGSALRGAADRNYPKLKDHIRGAM